MRKRSKTTGFLNDMSRAQLAKGIRPYPVYEAHFDDGEILRMSFWHKAGAPWDFDAPRTMLWKARAFRGFKPSLHSPAKPEPTPGIRITNGFIEHDGKRERDPKFYQPVAIATAGPVQKRVTAKQLKTVLKGVLDGDSDAIEQAKGMVQ